MIFLRSYHMDNDYNMRANVAGLSYALQFDMIGNSQPRLKQKLVNNNV